MSTTVDRTQEGAPRQPAPEIVRVSVPQALAGAPSCARSGSCGAVS